MNPLQSLAREALLSSTQALVAEERRITLELLEHLREIERRLLFAEMGYGSMHEFCTKFLGFSEGAAHRRISSMRLIRAVPEVKEQIQAGSLSLSSATQLQGFFVEEKKHGREYDRREVIGKVQGLSRRECEKKLFEISPTAIPKERERVLSDSKTEIKLILTEEVMEQLKELKSILAHALPNATYSELVGYLANQVLIKIKSPSTSTPPAGQTEKFRSTSTRRYLPRLLVRLIRQRAAWSCEYVADDGKRCTSQHALQVDHITPLALGGTNDPENLRLLCRAHNLQQASLKLGPVLMSRYLRLLKP